MGADMILVASDRPLVLAPAAAKLFPEAPEVAKDLNRVGVGNLADLALLYTSTVRPPSGKTLLNTDDNSLIQYRAPLELLRGIVPRRDFLRASKEDLLALFYPGAEEKQVLLDLGKAAYARQALPTLDYLVSQLAGMGDKQGAAELQGLASALREQTERAAKVQQSLTAAEARVSAHDPQTAVEALSDAVAAGLVTSEEWARAGMVYMSAGKYAEAEQALDQAVGLGDPRFQYQSLAARGASRFRLGRIEEGLADIATAKQLDPSGAVAYLLNALALHDAGDRDAAIQELQEGIKAAPEDQRLSTYLEAYLKESSSPASGPAAGH
jgi:tetratricopeptide (TPR) repeat protein